MNNYEGAYFPYYRKKGLDYAHPYLSKVRGDNFVTPDMLKKHYSFSGEISFGKGITIGIVEAYGYDRLQKDLDTFCEKFSLPKTAVRILSGKSSDISPAVSKKQWALETALDVQWAHVFAPYAEKRCYFADSDDFYDIFEMINIAGKECDIVSLSFGKKEFAGISKYEDILKKSKALFVCASGNQRYVSYPACSRHCLCVGGTDIYFYPGGKMLGKETLNEKSGCGFSCYVEALPHQKKLCEDHNKKMFAKRAVPDLCFFSGGNIGVAVIMNGVIETCMGTSIGAPCVSGICACVAELDRTMLVKKASYFYELAEKYESYNGEPLFHNILQKSEDPQFCTALGALNTDVILRLARTPV